MIQVGNQNGINSYLHKDLNMNGERLWQFMVDKYAVRKYGDAYFSISDFNLIVSECNKNNCALAGLEGFFVKNDNIVPDFNAIFDVTGRSSWRNEQWNKIVEETNLEVINFVENTCPKDDYLISMVIISKDEYNRSEPTIIVQIAESKKEDSEDEDQRL